MANGGHQPLKSAFLITLKNRCLHILGRKFWVIPNHRNDSFVVVT
jgi:hypothetical protein